MIVFPKGAWYALDAACDLGYNVVGLDWLHSPEEVLKTVGDRPITIQGNADPGILYGSHAAITEVVEEMVKGYDWANRKKGWIVNLGHGEWLHISLCVLSYCYGSNRVSIRRYYAICQSRGFEILLPGSPPSYQNGSAVMTVSCSIYKAQKRKKFSAFFGS